jgi:hypothetical protein
MDQQDSFEADIKALENTLMDRLHPIEPNQKFIGELAKDLAEASFNRRQRRLGQSLLISLGGLMIGWLIFWIGREFVKGEQG